MSVKNSLSVLILAGGQSTRMQQSKPLLPVAGRTLLEHVVASLAQQTVASTFDKLLIAGDAAQLPSIADATIIDDFLAEKHQGPLSGIAQALTQTSSDYVWVLSCDILRVPEHTLEILLSTAQASAAKIVYAQSASQRDYPLIAVWHKEVLPELQQFLLAGERRVMKFLQQVPSRACQITQLDDRLCNINTPAAFEQALTVYEQLLEKSAKP